MAKQKRRVILFRIPVEFEIHCKEKITEAKQKKYADAVNMLFEESFREEAVKHDTSIKITITDGMRFFGEATTKNSKLYAKLHDRLDRLAFVLGIL